jgi:GNAT superfamily N-acetyltransferase
MEDKPGAGFSIRIMKRADVEFAVKLAEGEGWNPGLADAECFYRADPEGFLLGVLDEKPVGCISAVSYEHQFGFIGLYIVAPQYRGKGYGIRLWQAAMQRLAGYNIGLDGVLDKEAVYMKSGFKRAYRNIRFEGMPSGAAIARKPEIKQLKSLSLDDVVSYDRLCFPVQRLEFLRCWLEQTHATALGYIENGCLKGYGVIRRCIRGYKIGPLFADNPVIAERLYICLAVETGNDGPVYLDVPEANPAALDLTARYRMKEVFATTRMYTGPAPALPLEKIFGITTFELG